MTAEMYVRGELYPTRYGAGVRPGVTLRAPVGAFPYHEAGHAIAAVTEGLEIWSITLQEDWQLAKEGGRSYLTIADSSDASPTFYAAGERAANRWLEEQGLWTPETAVSVEATAYTDRQYYDFRTAHDLADALLDAAWDWVVAVADALSVRRNLTGKDIADIVERMNA